MIKCVFNCLKFLVMLYIITPITPHGGYAFAATTYYVDDACSGPSHDGKADDPFCTIQVGIDASVAGDTVLVNAGTYHEHITMKSGVIIQGAGPGNSIIDGSSSGIVVTADNVDSTARLDGFTITNGYGDPGGGMKNTNSSPSVINCMFESNSTPTDGAGMINIDSSPVITGCQFINNSANYIGGGMLNINSSPVITNCKFKNNSASVDEGGGMANLNSSPSMINCEFSGNTAPEGGAVSNDSSSPFLTNCILFNNAVSYFGGAIYNSESSPALINCTLFHNMAGSNGGAIYSKDNSHPAIINTILWDNSTEAYSEPGSSLTATYSNIKGGYDGTGNINTDPIFEDPANGDLHLKANSPCIDAGNNAAPNLPEKDFEGDNRRINHPLINDTGYGSSPIVDMGADEYLYNDNFPWEIFYPAFIKKK